jgi:O-antigen/teichoic acid export membrane protein
MFRTAPEVGYYDIAAKLATLTTFVLSSINSITGPKFSQLFHTNKLEDLFRLAERSARLIFWTTTPILLGLLLLSRPILVRFLGSEYATAYPPLVLLVLGQFVNSASGATALFMNMTGNQKTFRNIIAAAAVMNIGLNLLFIPHFGIVGAAIAATISISFWNIATLLYMKSRYGRTTGYFPAISFQADKRPR